MKPHLGLALLSLFLPVTVHAVCEPERLAFCPECKAQVSDMVRRDLQQALPDIQRTIDLLKAPDTSGYNMDRPLKLKYYQCILSAKTSNEIGGDIDTVTPQVPGCPKYLRKSLVTWRQVGNPQLNTWEIRNRSDKTLKVTFREGGANSSPDTLPPGQSTQVSLSANQVPSYVVRDFDELFAFNRANGTSGKTLQCDLAIRPR